MPALTASSVGFWWGLVAGLAGAFVLFSAKSIVFENHSCDQSTSLLLRKKPDFANSRDESVQTLQTSSQYSAYCVTQPPGNKLVCPQRINVPDDAATLLRAGNFDAALALAADHGFVNVFAHMRKLSETVEGMLHPTLDHFDWVLQDQEQVVNAVHAQHGFFWTKGPGTPFRTVLTTGGTQSLTHLLKAIKRLSKAEIESRPDRTLVVCGSDDVLSGAGQQYFRYKRGVRKQILTSKKSPQDELMKKIRDTGAFASIRYEAMDTEIAGVQITPQPMSHRYTGYAGGEAILKALDGNTLERKKPHSILAAWGAVWKDLDKLVKSRKEAREWTDRSPLVNRSILTPQEYWPALVSKRFMIAPTGGAIQSPKVAEALLAMTIPITYQEVAYQKLAELGYPVVNVDSWDDITVEKLEHWWEILSPRLEQARWMLLVPLWGAYTTHPCPPGNIFDFLERIRKQPLLSEMASKCKKEPPRTNSHHFWEAPPPPPPPPSKCELADSARGGLVIGTGALRLAGGAKYVKGAHTTELCCAACIANPKCNAFTLAIDSPDKTTCFLKGNVFTGSTCSHKQCISGTRV